MIKQPVLNALLACIGLRRSRYIRHITEFREVGATITYLGEAHVIRKGLLRRYLEPTGQVGCPACQGATGIDASVDWLAPCPLTGEVERTVYRTRCCDSFIQPVLLGPDGRQTTFRNLATTTNWVLADANRSL